MSHQAIIFPDPAPGIQTSEVQNPYHSPSNTEVETQHSQKQRETQKTMVVYQTSMRITVKMK